MRHITEDANIVMLNALETRSKRENSEPATINMLNIDAVIGIVLDLFKNSGFKEKNPYHCHIQGTNTPVPA